MKTKIFLMFIAVLSIYSVSDAFASDRIFITDNQECITCREIAEKYNSLKANLESKRNNSDEIEAYENQIKKYKENLSSFLDTVYVGTFDLDGVSMDWNSNRLITKRELPFEFIGCEEGCKELLISTVIPHIRLRELITFKKHISYVITFKLNENCIMQFINIKVVYRGEEILNEMSLSSF